MEKLNKTEALRKVAHDALDEAIDQLMTLVGVGVGVPEGPPVGTIARRPDGEWIAWRTEDGWGYRFIGDEEPNEWPPGSNIADSWPVIYDPTNPEQKTYPYAEGDTIVIGPECFQVPSKGAIAWKGVWYFDPDYQLNWFPPGEEPLVPRPDPTAQQEPGESLARGLDDIAAGRVSRRDDYLEPQQEPADRLDLIDPIQRHRGDKPSRTPRVVYRLGVDERGSRWLDVAGMKWAHRYGAWGYITDSGCWFNANPEFSGPFKEILEPQPKAEGESSPKSSPRVLPSLNCEEARDGTVWRGQNGWRFWFNGEWRTDNGTRGRDLNLVVPRLLRGGGPYTEVLPDVAS